MPLKENGKKRKKSKSNILESLRILRETDYDTFNVQMGNNPQGDNKRESRKRPNKSSRQASGGGHAEGSKS